jgi:hypothetical protein
MSWNTSPLSFRDVRDMFDRALKSEKGITVRQDTRAQVVSLRARFNYFRKMDRKENASTYPADHPLHNTSAYDALILRIPPRGSPDELILYIEQRNASNYDVKEIE